MRMMESLAMVVFTSLLWDVLDFKYKCAAAKLCTQGKPVTYWSCSRSCVVKQNLHLNSPEVYTGTRLLFPRICALSVIFKDLSHTKGDFFSAYFIFFVFPGCAFLTSWIVSPGFPARHLSIQSLHIQLRSPEAG